MTEQYLYPVYETDAWHTLSNRDCKGIYTSKEEAIEAIAEHHNIPLDDFDGLTAEEAREQIVNSTSKCKFTEFFRKSILVVF